MSATEQDFVASFAEAVDADPTMDADVAVGTDDQERDKRAFLVTPGELAVRPRSHDAVWLSSEGIEAVRHLRCPFFIGRDILAVAGTGRRFRQTLSHLKDGNPFLDVARVNVIRTPLCGGPEVVCEDGEKIMLADQSEHSIESYCGISAIGPEAAWALVNQWLDKAVDDLLICAGQEFLEALGWPEAYLPATLYKLEPRHNWVDKIQVG